MCNNSYENSNSVFWLSFTGDACVRRHWSTHTVILYCNQVVCVCARIHAHLNLMFQFVRRTWYIASGCDRNMGRWGGHLTWLCTLTRRTVLFWLTSLRLTIIYHCTYTLTSCEAGPLKMGTRVLLSVRLNPISSRQYYSEFFDAKKIVFFVRHVQMFTLVRQSDR